MPPETHQSCLNQASSPCRHPGAEVAEQIAAFHGQKPQVIVLAREDWVGTEEVNEFLRLSEDMKTFKGNAGMLIRANQAEPV